MKGIACTAIFASQYLRCGLAPTNDSRHVFEAPSRSPPCTPAPGVQLRRDTAQRTAPCASDVLWLIPSRVRSPIASLSHCETDVIILIPSRPAAGPVSSDSAADT